MHRRPDVLIRRWRPLALTAALLVLSGAIVLVWLRIDAEARRGDAEARRTQQVEAEADRRGDALSTLAGDVRVLRAQIQAEGDVPAAPDPAVAVEDLPDRVEVPVPVPIPGAKGDRGAPGEPGTDGDAGANGTDGAPGEAGQPGEPGATVTGPPGPSGPAGPVGPSGPPGKDGADGSDGADGRDGRDGQTCPDGYSLQPPPGDPDGLMCRRTNAPPPDEPDPSPSPGPSLLGLPAERRRS